MKNETILRQRRQVAKKINKRHTSGCRLFLGLSADRINNQKGVALITVLIIAALVSILAVGMISSQQIDIRRTANMLDADNAFVLARGVEDWALQVLVRDQQAGVVDYLGEDWAMGLLPTEVEGGVVSGYLEDMQGRININNLLADDGNRVQYCRQELERLFENCSLSLDSLDALEEWLDADKFTKSGSSEDDEYLGLNTAYRTGNQPMLSVSELRLIVGIDEDKYQCLAPNLAALPPGTALNVNTMSAGVLAVLADNISPAVAQELVDSRPKNGYKNVSGFLNSPALTQLGVSGDFAVKTDYFMANSQAAIGHGEVRLYSLLTRRPTVQVLRRSIGVY